MMARFMRLITVVVAAGVALLAGAPLASAAPAAASTDTGTITIVHGVLGLVADVKVDGKQVLSGFDPQQVTSPLRLPVGAHHVQIFRSTDPPGSKPVLDTTLNVTNGEVATAAVGLSSAGKPTITVYPDHTINRGNTLAVRDIAAADPVAVRVASKVIGSSIVSPQGVATTVPTGSVPVSVALADGGSTLLPAQSVPVIKGRSTALYLIGSQQAKTLTWVAQTLTAPSTSAPSTVNTGYGPPPGYATQVLLARLRSMALLLLVGMALVGGTWFVTSRGVSLRSLSLRR